MHLVSHCLLYPLYLRMYAYVWNTPYAYACVHDLLWLLEYTFMHMFMFMIPDMVISLFVLAPVSFDPITVGPG